MDETTLSIILLVVSLVMLYGIIGVGKYAERSIPPPEDPVKVLISILFWPYIIKQLDGDKDE